MYLKANGVSPSVTAELSKAEARHRELESEAAKLAGPGIAIFPPPTKAIREGLMRLRETLYSDAVAAREMLKALVGELVLTPKPAGTDVTSAGVSDSQKEESRTPVYEVSGSAFLPNLLLTPTSVAGGPSVVAGARNAGLSRDQAPCLQGLSSGRLRLRPADASA